ncbi:putative transcriptional regulator [Methanomicrobium sp. W14]|nr:putative transcriptional regulator [Methanomicrobium sp. W14]
MRQEFKLISGVLLMVVFLISFYTASASSVEYSVQSWENSPPVGDSLAPDPLELWQVSPLMLAAVMLVAISPSLVVPAQIILTGLGLTMLNFRRVNNKAVLDNELRGSIYSFIVENPGVCFTGIEKEVGVNKGTLEYHLGMLRRGHKIYVFTKNRRSFYFENSGRYSAGEMEMLSVIRNDTERAICGYLYECPGASRNDIVSFARLTCSTVSWHMKRLCDSGAVFPTKDGKFISYHLSSPAKKIVEMISDQ